MAGRHDQHQQQDQAHDFVALQVDMGIVKSQMAQMSKQGERQEKKIDEIREQISQLSTVPRAEYEANKEAVDLRFGELDKRYIRRDSVKGLKTLGMTVAGAVAVAIVIAILKLIGFKV